MQYSFYEKKNFKFRELGTPQIPFLVIELEWTFYSVLTNSRGRNEGRTKTSQREEEKKQSSKNKLQSTCHLDKLISSLPETQPDIFILMGGGNF